MPATNFDAAEFERLVMDVAAISIAYGAAPPIGAPCQHRQRRPTMDNFDRLKFRHMLSEYGHAEFMLGLEGMSPDRGKWSRKAMECEKALLNYIDSLHDIRPSTPTPAGKDME